MNKIRLKYYKYPAYVLLFLMAVFPMVKELLYIKFSIFIFLLVFAFGSILKTNKLILNKQIKEWTLIITVAFLLFFFIGFFNNTPGAFKLMRLYIFWPWIYILIFTVITDKEFIVGIQRTLIFSTLALSILGISQVMVQFHILPTMFTFNLFENESSTALGLHDGFIELRLPGTNSLAFLMPFTLTVLLTQLPDKSNFQMSRIWIWITTFLGIIFSIISGRKAVWMVIILTPIFLFLTNYLLRNKKRNYQKKKYFITFLLLIILAPSTIILLNNFYDFDITKMKDMFINGFTSDDYRKIQFIDLWKGFSDSPIWGKGLGATVDINGYRHGEEAGGGSWNYELYYMALLMQIGILGFMIISSSIVWMYKKCFDIMKSNCFESQLMMPFLIGMTCMFIAGATNPLFARFDGLWFFFIPLLIINRWKIKQNISVSFNNNDKIN